MKQLSVFIENRKGRLEDVLKLLSEEKINIESLSLADTSDYGMLRLIVDDPDKGRAALKGKGFSATLSEVVAVPLSDESGSLAEVLHILSEKDINIEYMYAFTGKEETKVIFRFSDAEEGRNALKEANIKIFD